MATERLHQETNLTDPMALGTHPQAVEARAGFSLVDFVDKMTDRLRWAAGTCNALLENDNLEQIDLDTISSVCEHLRQATALMDKLEDWRSGRTDQRQEIVELAERLEAADATLFEPVLDKREGGWIVGTYRDGGYDSFDHRDNLDELRQLIELVVKADTPAATA